MAQSELEAFMAEQAGQVEVKFTAKDAERFFALSSAIKKANEQLDELKALAKEAFPEAGTYVVGDHSITIGQSNRLDEAKAVVAFPLVTNPEMWEPKFKGLKSIPEDKRDMYSKTITSVSVKQVTKVK